jgi:hypothetical protein
MGSFQLFLYFGCASVDSKKDDMRDLSPDILAGMV